MHPLSFLLGFGLGFIVGGALLGAAVYVFVILRVPVGL